MDKRKLIFSIIGLALAVALCVCALRPKRSPVGHKGAPTLVACTACGASETRSLNAVPDVCSKCGKTAVYAAVPCPRCKTPVAVKPLTGPQRGANFVDCPKCKNHFIPSAGIQGSQGLPGPAGGVRGGAKQGGRP